MSMRKYFMFLFLSASISVMGCKKEEIVVYRVAKSESSPAEKPSSGSEISWVAPTNWVSIPATGMRRASFNSGDGNGKVDISVIALPGPAGGTLSNINRWRGQIGLAALDPNTLDQEIKFVSSRAGRLVLVDFSNEGQRVMASILQPGKGVGPAVRQSWFFKMTGSVSAIEGAKPSFLEFIKSVTPTKAPLDKAEK